MFESVFQCRPVPKEIIYELLRHLYVRRGEYRREGVSRNVFYDFINAFLYFLLNSVCYIIDDIEGNAFVAVTLENGLFFCMNYVTHIQ
jgi:hypothetical protein